MILTILITVTASAVCYIIGNKVGHTNQLLDDLVYLRSTLNRVGDDYNLPPAFTDDMIDTLQYTLVTKQIPTCGCGTHIISSPHKHIHKDGMIHAFDQCDTE